ncbi:MAG: hypothetical protein NW201_03980 [Gemmatimonadales bacterium]|nr:hypothetical protein [Gemmatimonadales bacterium]
MPAGPFRPALPFVPALVLAAACGAARPAPGGAPDRREAAPRAGPPVALAEVFVLQSSGAVPAETTVTLVAGAARSVVLRHPAPGQEPYAELVLGAGAFAAEPGTAVTLRAAGVPGAYGLSVEADVPFGPVAPLLRFRYPRRFVPPPEVLRRPGGALAWERSLAVARLEPAGDSLRFLPSRHPAADMLEARLPAAGRYLVAAP